jgi:trigger factor
VVVGQGQAIPAVEALILQAAPGDTVEQDVTWPDDFPVEEERGKSKRVRVLVKEVKRKALPALDDDLARELGDFDSLDALTATVREDLGKQLARETDAEARAKLLDAIVDANPFDVPPSWVNQLVQSYAQAYQIPEQDLQRFGGEFRPLAERQVRRDLVVDAIAKRESLQATPADVDAEVEALAGARNQEPGQLYASLQKSNRLGEIEHGVTERKVFEWLAARNTTREVAGDADGGAPTAAERRGPQNAEGAEGGTENAGGTSAPAAE